ncbi:type VI secretion system protein TssA [Methylomarinum sp. Ch1-1]|uniref:Type VI secretion system protein TssA n=1 Tax=Methylomarinum roseum TaxID=3067653 RepID=A0AAU7NSF2_9GAMM|nr:type VI secretion system protein TssA [Methylomarinum sp. Ch1-1]MDP4520085.1 type VI secretion system protein TssA [Methylomarinum sp. Ch1-1]
MSVEIEDYLNEIDAEQSCGEDLEYDPDFIALEQAIKGKPEQQIGDTIQEAEPPNWKEVRKAAEQLLARTRDFRVLIFYLRALAALEGFAGFAQGLELLKKLTESFWQDIHPQLDPDDDNDPTERINILMSLCDFETLLRPIQHIPLVESRAFGKFTLMDIHVAEGQATASEGEAPQSSDIDGAFQDCDGEQLVKTARAIADSQQYLNDLENFVTEQVGVGDAPSFADLRKLLKEIDVILSAWIDRRALQADDAPEAETASAETAQGETAATPSRAAPQTAVSTINNSEDVRKALNLICDYYKKHEPSSPVPILLHRVLRLVGKDFMEIMKDMAPNGVEQVEFLSGAADHESSPE